MAAKFRLAEMTFIEFRDRMTGNPVILLPLGSQEEHGAVAPVGDWMLAQTLAERAAEKSDAIVAPTIPFGYGDNFRAIAGGVQLRADTFRRLLRDVCDNFLDHGLTRLLIVNGHTGNDPLVLETIRLIRRERGVIVPSVNIWRLATADVWKAAFGDSGSASSGHGAQPVASVYTYLFPHLMRQDLAEAPQRKPSFCGFPVAGMSAVRVGATEVMMPLSITDITDNGVSSGDPLATTAEAGRIFSEHIVDSLVGFVEKWAKVDPASPPAW